MGRAASLFTWPMCPLTIATTTQGLALSTLALWVPLEAQEERGWHCAHSPSLGALCLRLALGSPAEAWTQEARPPRPWLDVGPLVPPR